MRQAIDSPVLKSALLEALRFPCLKVIKRNAPSACAALLAVFLLTQLAVPQEALEVTEHAGMCDASAAVAVGSSMFLVANDEDNQLRVYRRDMPGKPVRTFDLSLFLKPDAENPEADIEGAASVGSRVYWIASHGANKNGKPRPSRRRLFATEVKVTNTTVDLSPVGEPYEKLVDDLTNDAGLKHYKFGKAAEQPPEAEGGLNIEGLAASPEGTLLIAFRNPIPEGKALVVSLENPNEVIAGERARLGTATELTLGGLGIRSIEYCHKIKKYLILAGRHDDAEVFELYQWEGPPSKTPEKVRGVGFAGVRPEALIIYPGEQDRIQVLSDDGSKQVADEDCKEAAQEMRRFRSLWVPLVSGKGTQP
jgi:Protein of unknown function (DUF3616)